MKIWVFMNNKNEFLVKSKGKIYPSKTELDRIISYRIESQSRNYLLKNDYWLYRGIDITKYDLVQIRLFLGVIIKVNCEPW